MPNIKIDWAPDTVTLLDLPFGAWLAILMLVITILSHCLPPLFEKVFERDISRLANWIRSTGGALGARISHGIRHTGRLCRFWVRRLFHRTPPSWIRGGILCFRDGSKYGHDPETGHLVLLELPFADRDNPLLNRYVFRPQAISEPAAEENTERQPQPHTLGWGLTRQRNHHGVPHGH